jgi:hypothetical protein
MEIWKEIDGFNGKYWVSNLARVKKVIGDMEKIYAISTKTKGYTTIRLDNKIYSLHRIVAKAFVEKTDDIKSEVNHIDGNKKNNIADNLEWVSHYENLKHAFDSGLVFRLSDDRRNEVRDLHKTGKYSYRKLASLFNVSLGTIQSILKGR